MGSRECTWPSLLHELDNANEKPVYRGLVGGSIEEFRVTTGSTGRGVAQAEDGWRTIAASCNDDRQALLVLTLVCTFTRVPREET